MKTKHVDSVIQVIILAQQVIFVSQILKIVMLILLSTLL